MTVTFYQNKSDERKVNKSITQKLQLSSIILKEDTSILRPILECHYDAKILQSNYLQIDTFSKYYFIDDITLAAGQRLIITCREDLLMSNKTQLYKTSAFVERSEKKSNLYINDPIFIARSDSIIDYILINKNKHFSTEYGDYVLAIAGGN